MCFLPFICPAHPQAAADALTSLTSAAELDLSALEAAEVSVNAAIGAFAPHCRHHQQSASSSIPPQSSSTINIINTTTIIINNQHHHQCHHNHYRRHYNHRHQCHNQTYTRNQKHRHPDLQLPPSSS
jgi:hypothetical protein